MNDRFNTETNEINFSKRELAALLAFASADFTRPQAYRVNVGPLAAWSTDGHTLTEVQYATECPLVWPHVGDVTIQRPDLEKALRLAKSKDVIAVRPGALVVRHADKRGNITASFTEVRIESNSTKSPPYKQILEPEARDDGRERLPFCNINPDYLARLADIKAACEESDGVTIVMGSAPLEPVIAYAQSECRGTKWRTLIMPMRLDSCIEARAKAWAEQTSERESARLREQTKAA